MSLTDSPQPNTLTPWGESLNRTPEENTLRYLSLNEVVHRVLKVQTQKGWALCSIMSGTFQYSYSPILLATMYLLVICFGSAHAPAQYFLMVTCKSARPPLPLTVWQLTQYTCSGHQYRRCGWTVQPLVLVLLLLPMPLLWLDCRVSHVAAASSLRSNGLAGV